MTVRRTTSRRDFLRGTSAAQAVVDLVDGADIPLSSGDESALPLPRRDHWVRLGRAAMACRFEVVLNAAQHAGGPAAALEALELVDRLEDQMTVYRAASEIVDINRDAFDEPAPVESRLFELLSRAVELHAATDGAFDVTAGPLTKVWGFYRRQGAIPEPDVLADALARVGTRHLQLDRASQTIRYLRPGVEINLGAIGKGYALDRAAERMLEAGVGDFLIHGGQSSVRARGVDATQPGSLGPSDANGPRGTDEIRKPVGWRVGVRHPLRPAARLAEIRLCDRALGTSGSGTQFFRHAGRRYGHILDPRTGWPAEGVLSTTVVAHTAAEADALSTALYVLGWERAMQFCQRRPDVAVLMVLPGKRSGSVQVETAGFADGELVLY